ncbi:MULTISPECIES: MarR family winged helix-turn-helix transcriptional regulator [unclassified Fusibacter]|uniref:MarR family winged helix-turn-helix transcriptional regulator n=1 Tax=unclassified Fusibacter TaxID=2624464 RepID=UPI001010A90A|nr:MULTISPECIES: MarR family transcriptional regulator [unclassified Fusibacter]MCK8058496.1 MarR family transcriptional regulator [Fusibacter sp. A2]NPE22735.1 MarR family transcriptional regulator [Fusibacter sp. A1]RXV60294.1 MarR family transcriptional regulator [Fusibacter sp. A1]
MNDKYIVYFVSKIKKKMTSFIEKKLEENAIYDLVPSYGNILTVLYDHDGKLSMKEIGELLGKEKSTITTLVSKLENQGYVRKVKSDTDKRVTFVELTEKSHQIESKFNQISTEVQDTAYKNFTHEEKSELLRLLKKLNCNFDD